MGLIRKALTSGAIASVGEAAEDLSEVFVTNATRRAELSQEAFAIAQDAAAEEYRQAGTSAFDRFVNGLNRLPRPLMALGTVGLFAYAMAEPDGFAARMVGLAEVPEPLWWLLGAVVGFYFGARELHYLRGPGLKGGGARPGRGLLDLFRRSPQRRPRAEDNRALTDWRASRGGGA